LFPPEARNTETFSLYHDDMSSNNILIDPTAHCITGMVDLGGISLQPSWKVGPEIDNDSPTPAAPPPLDKDADEFHLTIWNRCFCDEFFRRQNKAYRHQELGE